MIDRLIESSIDRLLNRVTGQLMDRVIDRLIDRLLDRVVALYPLREQRLELGLGDWDGPQLLYVCRGADVTGRWEPVIAPAPAPKVRLNRELLLVQPFPAGCSQQSLLCHPSIGLFFAILVSTSVDSR